MNESGICELMLQSYGLRIHPEMARYLIEKLNEVGVQSIPVMGANARTGAAIRRFLTADELRRRIDESSRDSY